MECNWPFWACLDGKSRAVLTDYQRTYYNPKWQAPQIDWGGVRSGRIPPAEEKAETTEHIMSAKPQYSNSGWRK